MSKETKTECLEIMNTSIEPMKIEIDFQEYQALNRKLTESEKNLYIKTEIIVTLETLIATMGTEEMRNEMLLKVAEIISRES